MARLDKDKQKELEPKRMDNAKEELKKLGYDIVFETETELQFMFKGKTVRFFPYSGWHSGASIIDGRGINKLLKQIKI